jgi:hypothetical protein
MSKKFLFAACLAFSAGALAATPAEQLKGKVKEGLYENTMEMDMSGVPGMPKGMGVQKHTGTVCVTAQDIEKGMAPKAPGREGSGDCEIQDFKMSGNKASYKMVCKGTMTADANMTFIDNGYDMDLKMAMNQGGQVMNMTQKIQSRYKGPCKK